MSTKPAVFVTRKLPDAVTARLGKSYNAHLNPEDKLLSPADIIEGAGKMGADALLICPTDKMTPELLQALPKSIRAIATFSVGHEHINLDAAKARNIVVTNTPDVLTDATADITMLLLLGAARRASEGEKIVRTNSWNSWGTTYMLGVHVTGKRLGILGMGRIGQARGQARPRLRHEDPLCQPPPAAGRAGTGRDLSCQRRRDAAAIATSCRSTARPRRRPIIS